MEISYDFLESTTSLCPECMQTVPGKIVARDGRVYIRKHCAVHGRQEELSQTAGLVRMDDFVAVTFLYRQQGTYVPITRGIDLRQHLPYIRNTFAFRAEEFITATQSAAACCGLLERFMPTFLLKSKPERVQYINDNLFRLNVVSFIDAYNFDMKAMQKECVHVVTPDLHKIPFSAYNMLHRSKYVSHYLATY
ncbi:MAG: hypothetical protein NTV46_06400 [Verrucomicrobia bacterium]|nr:hypothetical protein [Verrucomicrobiota bacterium]